MRRRFRASARSAPARRWWRSAASTTSEIRLREPILAPDALIVQDPTLLHQVDVFQGLQPDGYVLINSKRSFDELGLAEIARRFRRERLLHGAGDRARAQAPRPAAAQRRAARRLRGAVRPDHARRRSRTRSAPSSPARSAEANVAAATRGLRASSADELEETAHAEADSKARAPSPRRWRCAAPR